jgi:DNA-directed RNA polymerase specialized sigma24 family protein
MSRVTASPDEYRAVDDRSPFRIWPSVGKLAVEGRRSQIMAAAGEARGFPSTQWSLVAQAGQQDAEARREALGQLLARYLPALQAHLVHRRRLPPEKADDLVQEFVAQKILEKDLVARADQRLGKFRTLLLTALDRFVSNKLRDEHARKRAPGGGGAILGFDEHYEGASAGRQPSEAFDVAWARGVIAEALSRMQAECEALGRHDVWGVFQCRVVGPILDATPPVDYGQLVERFGFQSPAQASNVLTTAKRMYARALRSTVGQYAQDNEEIDSEINELKEILARCGK